MIQLRLEEDGLVIETNDEKIHLPIISSFLKSHGFVVKSKTTLKLSGEIHAGTVEIISLYLKAFFPDIEIQSTAKSQIEKREKRRTDVKNL